MVPLSAEHVTRSAELVRSVDLAIRDLLVEEDDQFALAVYLWTIRQHDLALVNGDGLAAWGAAWARRVLIEGAVGRRADEQITAAALAAAALAGTDALADVAGEVRAGVARHLAAELDRRSVPFGRPVYAAALLLATSVLGVDEPRLAAAAASVAAGFGGGGRAFGAGFAGELLDRLGEREHLAALARRAAAALADPRTGYEDQLYLLQALRPPADPQFDERAERVVARSPAWTYLMVGTEDVAAAGDGRTPVPVSHLCRAVLLDVALRVRASAAARKRSALEARYRGRRLVGLAAFGFGLVLLAACWYVLVRLMAPWADAGRRYWLLNDYAALAVPQALLVMTGVLVASFLLPFTFVALWTLWSVLVRSAVESDRWIAELLARRTVGVAKAWATLVAVAAIVNLTTGSCGQAFQHALGGG